MVLTKFSLVNEVSTFSSDSVWECALITKFSENIAIVWLLYDVESVNYVGVA